METFNTSQTFKALREIFIEGKFAGHNTSISKENEKFEAIIAADQKSVLIKTKIHTERITHSEFSGKKLTSRIAEEKPP